MRSALVIGLLVLVSCSQKVTVSDARSSAEQASYISSVETARKQRLSNLKEPQGWLSVIGLHWLSPGVNTIGASADNKIIFPRIKTETIGAYQLKDNEVFFGKVEGVEVQHNGVEYMGGPVDVSYPPTVVNHESLYWYIIQRGEKYAIRLKDTLADQRLTFNGIPYSPINRKYRVVAQVRKPASEETVSITNVLGSIRDFPISAELTFTLDGKEHNVVALDEGGDNYFVILGDTSNGDTTYGGGRFLYPKKPDEGTQTTILDFNLLQNPPCAFSDFATCPLPPLRNVLEINLPVGELKVDH